MTRRRIGLGLLTTLLVGLAITVALREAKDFERISGVTRRDDPSPEATLKGTGTEAAPGDADASGDPSVAATEAAPAAGTWTVTVRVLDLGRRPVAGATVHASDADGRRTSTTDASGVARVRTAQPQVGLRLDGSWGGAAFATRRRAEVTLLRVHRLPLAVRVVDPADRPVAGAEVRARYTTCTPEPDDSFSAEMSEGETLLGTTDDDGRCTAPLPVTVDWLKLEVDHEHGHAATLVSFPFEREATLRLGPRRWIECVIVDAEGRRLPSEGDLVAHPLERGRGAVRLHDHPWFREEVLEYEDPDEDAPPRPPPSVTLGVPDAGPWHVRFEPDAAGWADSDPVLVTAPAEDVRLVLRRAVSIRGRVLDAGEEAFQVQWLPAETATGGRRRTHAARTDAQGDFTIEGLAPGPGRLFARSETDDRYVLLENVEAPLDGIRLRPVEGFAIVGRVEGYEAPADLPGSRLSVMALDGPLLAHATVVAPGPVEDGTVPGSFRIRALPPGRYDLRWHWRTPWGSSSGRWRAFGATVDLGPETRPVVLPCPR